MQVLDDVLLFNGVNLLSVTGSRFVGSDTFRYPKRNVTNYDLANADSSTTTSAFYTGKPVNIRLVIARNSRDDLDTSISELRRLLEPINAVLQIPIQGTPRKYNECTVSNIAFKDVSGGYISVDIEFLSADPFYYDTTTTTMLSVANLTSGNKSYPVTVYGTAKQLPVITYTLDSFTTGSNRTVTFTNPTTGATMSIQRTWVAAEVLTIDCFNRTVQVDGTGVDFSGNFLEWSIGAGFVNYTDDFTARQVDISIVYYKRYL